MGFFDIFRSSDKAVDAAVYAGKKAVDGIDAIWYTDEEKAVDSLKRGEMMLKAGELALEHVKTAIGETTAQTLSRRYLAWGVFTGGGLLTLTSLVAKMFDYNEVSAHALALLKIWWPIILAAGLFYFGAHVLRAIKK